MRLATHGRKSETGGVLMSMYAMIHGKNAASDWLLALLNLTKADVGRFRDAWVNRADDGKTEIAVYTRNGGGNREHYDSDKEAGMDCHCTGCTIEEHLPRHPLYLRDQDDDFDSTYATIFFAAPEAAIPMLEGLAENRDPDKAWLDALDALKEGKRPDVVEKFRPLMEAIASSLK